MSPLPCGSVVFTFTFADEFACTTSRFNPISILLPEIDGLLQAERIARFLAVPDDHHLELKRATETQIAASATSGSINDE